MVYTKALRDMKTSIYILSMSFFKKLDAVSTSIKICLSRSHFFLCLIRQSLFPNEGQEAQKWVHGIHVLQN